MSRWARLRDRYCDLFPKRVKERGYVAVMTALLMTTLMGLAAFAVDVGNWYMVGQQEQAAADAAVMAGVTYLPGDPAQAVSTALNYSKANDFANGANATIVTAAVDGGPTRLRVTVDRTVTNFFGSLLGMSTTKIGRSAVADFALPVVMGSPCNRFGNNVDPLVGGVTTEASTCSGVLGGFWANVNSKKSDKVNGDAYQGNDCASTVDGCSGSSSGPNIDYTADGYYYTVSVKASMPSLTIQLFDPVSVHQGLSCSGGENMWGDRDDPDENDSNANEARNSIVTDESTRYDDGSSSQYCTGDALFNTSGATMDTEFTVRSPGTSSWDVTTFPEVTSVGCTKKVYGGFEGLIFDVLDEFTSGGGTESDYDADIADGFRRWTTLCTIANPEVGDYLIQVKTNGLAPTADGTNHFSIRAYGTNAGDKENLAISGREKMSIYANKPGVTTEFHLARVPTTAAGQTLRVRLFDVGDTAAGGSSGTINIIKPPDAGGAAFGAAGALCIGVRSTNSPVNLTGCSLTGVQSSTHNGKWQSISVPIPADYTCTDADSTMCWVRLRYVYGSSTSPNDVTSWTAILEGDPVRLIE